MDAGDERKGKKEQLNLHQNQPKNENEIEIGDDKAAEVETEISGYEMSQDCVFWNENEENNNSSSTVGPGSPMFRPGHALARHPSPKELASHKISSLKLATRFPVSVPTKQRSPPETATLFNILGNDHRGQIIPSGDQVIPTVTDSTLQMNDSSEFPVPRHRYESVDKGIGHSFPPSHKHPDSRKRSDAHIHAQEKRKDKQRKLSEVVQNYKHSQISPIPGLLKIQSENPNEDNKHFGEMLGHIGTPSPNQLVPPTTSRGPDESRTKNEEISKPTSNAAFHANTRNLESLAKAGRRGIEVQPKKLNEQAFEKENVGVVNKRRGKAAQKHPLSTKTNASTIHYPNQQVAPTNKSRNAFVNEEKVQISPRGPNQHESIQKPVNEALDSSACDNDEFGGFELSDADFANLDSLVAASQKQSRTPPPRDSTSSNPINVVSCAVSKCQSSKDVMQAWKVSEPLQKSIHSISVTPPETGTRVCQQVPPARGNNPLLEGDDLFGDFPDIDFDAIDAAVATQQTQNNGFKQNASATTVTNANECQVPAPHCPIRNARSDSFNDDKSCFSFTRYKVHAVERDDSSFTQILHLQVWDTSMINDWYRQALHKPSSVRKRPTLDPAFVDATNIGILVLRGSWFWLHVDRGDVLHLCSLTGRFKTDFTALPIVLNTEPPCGSDFDDLVPILHPELLAIPTTIADTLDCKRRAVLKNRLGSSVSTSKALLFGSLRHNLFEAALGEANCTQEFIQQTIKKILCSHAEKLVGCNMSTKEAERELLSFWPQVQKFKRQFMRASGANSQDLSRIKSVDGKTANFAVTGIVGVEEEIRSPELGLKGNVDALVEAIIKPVDGIGNGLCTAQKSIQPTLYMPIELKTNHNTNANRLHFAQLAYYIVMLLAREGHTSSATLKRNPGAVDAIAESMLLYINSEKMNPLMVSPNLMEFKSLIEQRNIFCAAAVKASRPRGIELKYDDADDETPRIAIVEAPPANLPPLQAASQCSRCFSARECMLYAASGSSEKENDTGTDAAVSHMEVLAKYTSQLGVDELEYFRKWDRLIDLEADASCHVVSDAWLEASKIREKKTGKSISSLTYQPEGAETASSFDDDSVAFVRLVRSLGSREQTPLSSLNLQKGSYVSCSSDVTSLDAHVKMYRSIKGRQKDKHQQFRHQMNIFRGTVEDINDDNTIVIRASSKSVKRMNELHAKFQDYAIQSDEGVSELEFRLDIDESNSLVGTLRRNLVDFLTKDKEETDNKGDIPRVRQMWSQRRLSRLRELVIQLQPPTFETVRQEIMFNAPRGARELPGCDPMELIFEYADLNVDQQAAAQMVASMRDYALIQGLPGTGKTSTIVFIARMLVAQGKRVLITSYTHSAVDNCLLKLIEKGVAQVHGTKRLPAVVRIGEKTKVHPGVEDILVSKLAWDLEGNQSANKVSSPSAESLRKVLSEARIVGATALKIPKSPLLMSEQFDVVIVDESGQISQPSVLGALTRADSFVLVGDHKQLPPLVTSEAALEGGYGESLLKRLAEAHPASISQLTLQYRMRHEICSLASNAVYDGHMKSAVEVPRLSAPGFPRALLSLGTKCQWLKNVLNPFRPVIFADTDGIRDGSDSGVDSGAFVSLERNVTRQKGGNVVNDVEAVLVRAIVQGLVAIGLDPSAIGILCPFNAQIRLLDDIQELQHLQSKGLEISTIDKYQGRDKDVIVASFVRSNSKGHVGRLLEDVRRVNVAVTRAKQKLILVGSFTTLQKGSTTLKDILDQIYRSKWIETLPSDAVQAFLAGAAQN